MLLLPLQLLLQLLGILSRTAVRSQPEAVYTVVVKQVRQDSRPCGATLPSRWWLATAERQRNADAWLATVSTSCCLLADQNNSPAITNADNSDLIYIKLLQNNQETYCLSTFRLHVGSLHQDWLPVPVLIFSVFKIASYSPYWLQMKFSISLFFYLFIFAINLRHRKFITADVTAVFVNNQHGIQR